MSRQEVPETVSVTKPIVGDREEERLLEVLHSGRYLQGKYVEEFERKWAEACGVDHAIAVSNGTAAVHLILEALGVGRGDTVAVPAMSFGATAEAVYHAGATPVFVDVEEGTHNIDPEDLRRVVEDENVDLAAALPVHLYGHPAAMDRIVSLGEEYDFHVVEDAAQAHGAALDGRPVGSLGRAGCFSFYATKNITCGEGGAITTDDETLAERLRLLRNHGMTSRDDHGVVGWNYRMSEFNGALGSAQVDRLADFNEKRASITRRLRDELSDVDWLEPLARREGVEHAWFWAPFATKRDGNYVDGKVIHERLRDAGVETRHRYTRPLQDQPAFDVDVERSLPTARTVTGNVIGLPNHPDLTEAEFDAVVRRIRRFEPDR